jgi:hypothetical protein
MRGGAIHCVVAVSIKCLSFAHAFHVVGHTRIGQQAAVHFADAESVKVPVPQNGFLQL